MLSFLVSKDTIMYFNTVIKRHLSTKPGRGRGDRHLLLSQCKSRKIVFLLKIINTTTNYSKFITKPYF